jgi:hypothetical protein
MAAFSSGRMFRVSSFNPTHRQLIIRSDPERGPDSAARIEIYFGNVEYMALSPWLRGVNVRRASAAERELIRDRFGIEESLDYAFIVADGPPLSFVISGKPAWREAVRAVDEPSLFDFSAPWPPGDEMKWGGVE